MLTPRCATGGARLVSGLVGATVAPAASAEVEPKPHADKRAQCEDTVDACYRHCSAQYPRDEFGLEECEIGCDERYDRCVQKYGGRGCEPDPDAEVYLDCGVDVSDCGGCDIEPVETDGDDGDDGWYDDDEWYDDEDDGEDDGEDDVEYDEYDGPDDEPYDPAPDDEPYDPE